MEEAAVSDLLRSERLGHEVPGMRASNGQVSPAMRREPKTMLQRWETSLRERHGCPLDRSRRFWTRSWRLSGTAREDRLPFR